jgi:protease-4
MKRTTTLFLALMGVGLALATCFVAVGILVTDRPLVSPDGAVLRLDIAGSLPERDADAALHDLLGLKLVTVSTLVDAIDAAAADDKIAALQVRVAYLDTGWGKAREVRDALTRFRASGKPVWAFLEGGDDGTYFIASAADRIWAIESGTLWLDGINAEVEFYAGTLAKVGVQADLEQVGPYKTGADVWEQTEMTAEHREVIDTLLDGLYGELVDAVAESVGCTPEEAKDVISSGPYTAEAALSADLVDSLGFMDEMEAALDEELGQGDVERVELGSFLASRSAPRGDRTIAVITCAGEIYPGESQDDLFGDAVVGSDTIAEAIEDAASAKGVAAIVLRVDSPGGSPVASDVIWRAVVRAQERWQTPVVVSMSDVAASGGYWIGMGAQHVVAEPTTITGSIGVYGGKYVTAGLFELIGMRAVAVERGDNADINSTLQPFTPEQRTNIRAQLQLIYEMFLAKTAEGRGFESTQEVHALAEGRVWTGRQALERGLVDELGGMREALLAAKRLASIDEDEPVTVREYPPTPGLLEMLTDSNLVAGLGDSARRALARHATRGVAPELRRLAAAARRLQQLRTEGVLAVLPYRVAAR